MNGGSVQDPRLVRLLGGDALANLRGRLRRFYERSPQGQPVSTISLTNLAEGERTALGALVGRRGSTQRSMRLDVQAVDTALREAGLAPSLRDALVLLDGPIVDRKALALREADLWAGVVAGCRRDDLRSLLAVPRGLGLLKRLSEGRPTQASVLCRLAETVLDRLPTAGIPRAQAAAELRGDAHDLDKSRPIATLVLSVLRSRGATQEDTDRDVWASVGILVNELARPALVLNLPVEGEPVDAGEPCYFSLRRLARRPPKWLVSGKNILVCENPNLVAILADRLGTSCPPVACVDGNMGAAQQTVLRQLRNAGAVLHYHGDYDWPGLSIANNVMATYGAVPWHFSADDYVRAAEIAPKPSARLAGQPVDAIWDKALREAMIRFGIKVQEEALADAIVERLQNHSF